MKFWDNIRNYFYKKNLGKRLLGLNTNRNVTNLQDAKTIGIIYDSTHADNDIIITQFAEELRNQGKTVDILGYVNDNKTEHKDDIVIFNKKNVSWTRIPQGDKVENFAIKNFDLLLACYTDENLPLEYVAQTSKAKWRVGAYSNDKTACYDMMISVGDKKDLQYLIGQTIYFLNQIKYDSK